MVIQKSIEDKLNREFSPSYLQIINESSNHNVPPNSETHFKVIIVSDSFSGSMKVRRQQAVYGVLSAELAGEVHALSMQTYTPEEWANSPDFIESPPCLGGGQ